MTLHPAVSQSMLATRPSRLGLFIGVSISGHALLVVFGLFYSYVTSGPRVDPSPTVIRATLVRQGKPRDQKLLPRKEELPPPPKEVKAPPAPPTEAPKPPEKVAVPVPGLKPEPKPAPQKGDTAADRRKRLFGAFDKTAKQAPNEELEGAEDGDPSGDSATAEGERYYALLASQIRRNYDVAENITKEERPSLKAQVKVRLGRGGEVLDAALSSSSGNELFDGIVVAAVRKASPFSPPPDHLRDLLQKQGVVLEFRP